MKNFELLPGKVCSMTLKPLALHSSMDKTPIGKEMFIRNTSGPKDPSSKSKNCFSGTVSAKSPGGKKKKIKAKFVLHFKARQRFYPQSVT